MSSWRDIADDREKYKAYLCSREWALLRNAVRARCGGKCERCGVNEMECVHHLTYARKYDERIDDLAGWCNACHEFTHGKTDVDPVASLSVSQFIAIHGWCEKMSRSDFIGFIDTVVSKGWGTYGEIYCYAQLGKCAVNRMGRDWLIDAAEGKFTAGSSAGVSELHELIARRRQEQGIQ
jgi:hypothetical protein